jgi:hypothetical protein
LTRTFSLLARYSFLSTAQPTAGRSFAPASQPRVTNRGTWPRQTTAGRGPAKLRRDASQPRATNHGTLRSPALQITGRYAAPRYKSRDATQPLEKRTFPEAGTRRPLKGTWDCRLDPHIVGIERASGKVSSRRSGWLPDPVTAVRATQGARRTPGSPMPLDGNAATVRPA